MGYFDELSCAMTLLGERHDTTFLGQAVGCPGTAMFKTLAGVAADERIELPVFEDTQMGISIGLALSGHVPVSIYPRWNFLLLATNQVVNHLDKLSAISHGGFVPKVIIRTAIGSQVPLHPQHQHVGDFTDAFREMLTSVDVIRLEEPEDIVPAYELAYERDDGRSTILVEHGDYYNTK